MPSPLGTLRPPASAIRFVTPAGVTVKSVPVLDWTITSVVPSGVASIPLTLNPS